MIYLGTDKIGQVFLGTAEIGKVYLGSELVWQKDGGGSTSRLPDGYTEVEYIENTTTARINTGISGISVWNITAQLTTTPSTSAVLIGRGTAGGHYFGSIPTVNYQWGAGSSSGQYVSAVATAKTDITLNITSKKIMAGTIGGETFSRTASANSSTVFYLFNATASGSFPFLGRVYADVVCTQGGTEVFRGVPCLNPSNVAGLYDLIGGTFIGSSNSATFTAGPAV